MVESLVDKPYTLGQRPRWLVANLRDSWNVLSWAIVNGGFQRTNQAAWLYLKKDEIAAAGDAREWMRAEMRAANLASAVGFMTSRREHAFTEASATEGDCRCWAVGTLGFSNAVRVGDPVREHSGHGTVNLMVYCSHALTPEAATELIAIVAEAKTLAVLSAGIGSTQSGLTATGTGTDYLAVTWPASGERHRYAGKHTEAGSATGRAALLAVTAGIEAWTKEQPRP